MTYHTGMVFHSLFRAHHNTINSLLTARGVRDLGSPQVLLVIREFQEQCGRPPSQRDLADRLHVSAATIATSLKSLERNGYVERSTDPEDSRRNQIAITQKAAEALKTGWAVFQTVDECMFSGFSREEVEQINRFHLRMLQNLYQIGGDTDSFRLPPQSQAKEEP